MALDVTFLDWGQIDYGEALKKQKELLKARQENQIKDTFVFCEHDEVITVGRGKAKVGELPFVAPKNIPVLHVERGGLATYHGPGQLVCYPIVRLLPENQTQFPGGIVRFIRYLEDWIIRVLGHFDLRAWSIDKKTGVWVGDPASPKKIASIGLAVSHWVTYHGLAFNFATKLESWQGFNPCGLPGDLMTDLSVFSRKSPNYTDLKALFVACFE